MPNSIGGVPLHPLVVHGVVVLLPLAALGVLLLAAVPRLRKNYATWVLGLTVVATGLVPVATQTGEQLQGAVNQTADVQRHAQLGNAMTWFALPLLFVAVAIWWVARKERAGQDVSRGLTVAVSVVSVVVAVAAMVMIVLVGHSGAETVWKGVAVSGTGGESG